MVVIGQKNAEASRYQRQPFVDIIWIIGTTGAQTFAQRVGAMHLAGVWVHPIDIFGVLVIAEAFSTLVAQIVAQIKPKILATLFPPIIVNVEFGLDGWAKAR